MEITFLILQSVKYGFCKFNTAFASFFPYFGKGKITISFFAEITDKCSFFFAVGNKSI